MLHNIFTPLTHIYMWVWLWSDKGDARYVTVRCNFFSSFYFWGLIFVMSDPFRVYFSGTDTTSEYCILIEGDWDIKIKLFD